MHSTWTGYWMLKTYSIIGSFATSKYGFHHRIQALAVREESKATRISTSTWCFLDHQSNCSALKNIVYYKSHITTTEIMHYCEVVYEMHDGLGNHNALKKTLRTSKKLTIVASLWSISWKVTALTRGTRYHGETGDWEKHYGIGHDPHRQYPPI